MNDSKKIVALKVLAVFLNQPEKDISCMELTGGSEEGTYSSVPIKMQTM